MPCLRTKFGETAFPFSGPSAWNALPADIRDEICTATFKKKLKTFYFSLAFDCIWHRFYVTFVMHLPSYSSGGTTKFLTWTWTWTWTCVFRQRKRRRRRRRRRKRRLRKKKRKKLHRRQRQNLQLQKSLLQSPQLQKNQLQHQKNLQRTRRRKTRSVRKSRKRREKNEKKTRHMSLNEHSVQRLTSSHCSTRLR